jgi:hypothetical protein
MDCFRVRNDGKGKSQKECEGPEGERGDKGDVRPSVGGSLGRRRSVLGRDPIRESVSVLQMVEVSSNWVG